MTAPHPTPLPGGTGGVPPPRAGLWRLRWAVRATLALGVIASVSANVLHARHNPISQTIAAWPPCALLLTIEIIAQVPVHRRWLAGVRLLATAAIAGIAAYISYTHMVAVSLTFGESALASRLLPISVDGLVIVSSVSLVELTGRVRALDHPRKTAGTPGASARPGGDTPACAPADSSAPRKPRPPDPPTAPPVRLAAVADLTDRVPARIRDNAPGQGTSAVDRSADPASEPQAFAIDGDDATGMPAHTADAVVYWLRQDPSLQPADIAAKLGRSMRTVRRYWPRDGLDDPACLRVNGHRPTVPPQDPDIQPTQHPQ